MVLIMEIGGEGWTPFPVCVVWEVTVLQARASCRLVPKSLSCAVVRRCVAVLLLLNLLLVSQCVWTACCWRWLSRELAAGGCVHASRRVPAARGRQ